MQLSHPGFKLNKPQLRFRSQCSFPSTPTTQGVRLQAIWLPWRPCLGLEIAWQICIWPLKTQLKCHVLKSHFSTFTDSIVCNHHGTTGVSRALYCACHLWYCLILLVILYSTEPTPL